MRVSLLCGAKQMLSFKAVNHPCFLLRRRDPMLHPRMIGHRVNITPCEGGDGQAVSRQPSHNGREHDVRRAKFAEQDTACI